MSMTISLHIILSKKIHPKNKHHWGNWQADYSVWPYLFNRTRASWIGAVTRTKLPTDWLTDWTGFYYITLISDHLVRSMYPSVAAAPVSMAMFGSMYQVTLGWQIGEFPTQSDGGSIQVMRRTKSFNTRLLHSTYYIQLPSSGRQKTCSVLVFKWVLLIIWHTSISFR